MCTVLYGAYNGALRRVKPPQRATCLASLAQLARDWAQTIGALARGFNPEATRAAGIEMCSHKNPYTLDDVHVFVSNVVGY